MINNIIIVLYTFKMTLLKMKCITRWDDWLLGPVCEPHRCGAISGNAVIHSIPYGTLTKNAGWNYQWEYCYSFHPIRNTNEERWILHLKGPSL